MDFLGLTTAVLIANLLTAMFIYGCVQASREERAGGLPSWGSLAAIALPVLLGMAGLYLNSGPPQILAAATALQ
ncbi:hypothetical protein PhaeoP51_03506 [Phaeobacter inhibens]|nr:hypothetical protein PhaeoP51_03506 [Phaeobacter inhibens]